MNPVLPDVLARGLKVVFCGTAAGNESARVKAYYAGRGNRFWPMLHETGMTPRRLPPADYARVLSYGMGLTDLAKNTSGSDHSLQRSDFSVNNLRNKLHTYEPAILAFTSKKAASIFCGGKVEYGLQSISEGRTRIFVLPSPSGAARRYWDPEIWHQLARMVRPGPSSIS